MGADVPVHDAQRAAVQPHHAVGVVQAHGGLGDHPQGEPQGHTALAVAFDAGQRGQVTAVDELHGDEVLAVLLAQFVDLHDVGMSELGSHAGLVQQHLGDVLGAGMLGQQLLEHGEALQAGHAVLAGQENLGHTALAQLAQHPVGGAGGPAICDESLGHGW